MPGPSALHTFWEQDKESILEQTKDSVDLQKSHIDWIDNLFREEDNREDCGQYLTLIDSLLVHLFASEDFPLPDSECGYETNASASPPPSVTRRSSPTPSVPSPRSPSPDLAASLPPQITHNANAIWELIDPERRIKIANAFYIIHGDRNRQQTLNWWNELSPEEQEEILTDEPLPSEPPTPEPPGAPKPRRTQSGRQTGTTLASPDFRTSGTPATMAPPDPRGDEEVMEEYHDLKRLAGNSSRLRTIATGLFAAWGYITVTAVTSVTNAPSWMPAATTIATAAYLRELYAAWDNHVKVRDAKIAEGEHIAQKTQWEHLAAKAVRDAASELERLEDEVNRLKNGSAHASPEATEAIINGLKNTGKRLGRLPATDKTQRLQKLLNDLIQALSRRGKGAALNIDSEPAESDILSRHAHSDATTNQFNHNRQRNNPHMAYVRMRAGNDDVAMGGTHEDFPANTPVVTGGIKYLEPVKPFEYDGKPETWRSWTRELSLWVSTNHNRFMSRGHVFNDVMALTKPGTQAKIVFEQLFSEIFLPTGAFRTDFFALAGAYQELEWILRLIQPEFYTKAYQLGLHSKWEQLHQRNHDFANYLRYADNLRMELDYSLERALPHIVERADKDTIRELALLCNKTKDALSWHDLKTTGAEADHQQKEHHKRHRPAAAPKTVPGHAAQLAPVTHQLGERKRLSDADFKYVHQGGGCHKCFWPGHRSADCTNELGSTLSAKQKEYLLAAAKKRQATRSAPQHGRQAFVPASNNPFAPATASEARSTGVNTPPSSSSSSN